jgi:hypothetical protein
VCTNAQPFRNAADRALRIFHFRTTSVATFLSRRKCQE